MRIWTFITPLSQLSAILIIAGIYFAFSTIPEGRELGMNALIIGGCLLFLKIVFTIALKDRVNSMWWVEGSTAFMLFVIVILHELHVPYFE